MPISSNIKCSPLYLLALIVMTTTLMLGSDPVLGQIASDSPQANNVDTIEGIEEVDAELDSLDEVRVSENVYQIELIVFAYKNVQADEAWSESGIFKYPPRLRALSSDRTAEFLPAIAPQQLEDEKTSLAMGELFQLIDTKQMQLKAIADDFRLRQGYRLLFHGAWYQQAQHPDEASAILIEGGQWFNPFYQLSGYIRLGKARFLQLQTNLWLSHFANSDLGSKTIPWHASYGLQKKVAIQSSRDAQRIIDKANVDEINVDVLDPTQHGSPLLFEYDQRPQFNTKAFHPLQVFQLKERRKLRNGELHYIDHPKFGVIVKVRKLDDVFKERLP